MKDSLEKGHDFQDNDMSKQWLSSYWHWEHFSFYKLN